MKKSLKERKVSEKGRCPYLQEESTEAKIK